jgi:hypothetical protein
LVHPTPLKQLHLVHKYLQLQQWPIFFFFLIRIRKRGKRKSFFYEMKMKRTGSMRRIKKNHGEQNDGPDGGMQNYSNQ